MTIHQEMLGDARTRAATLSEVLERETSVKMIVSHAWILTDALGRGVMFDVVPEGNKFRATTTGFGLVEKVNRFTKKDAFKLMKDLDLTAVHWLDAAQKNLDDVNFVIKMIEGWEADHA